MNTEQLIIKRGVNHLKVSGFFSSNSALSALFKMPVLCCTEVLAKCC